MSPETIFRIQLVAGYAACMLCLSTYVLPRLRSMNSIDAHRVIATVHSFRFFGLVFLLSGVVGPSLPAGFATFAAYGDFATGLLAILALMSVRIRPLFWTFVVGFNVAGLADLLVDYYHAIRLNVPAIAGQLGAMYWVPILYVPVLMITHLFALYLLVRPHSLEVGVLKGEEAAL
jgi:hypothetical protein